MSPYLKIEIKTLRSWLSKSIISITKWGFGLSMVAGTHFKANSVIAFFDQLDFFLVKYPFSILRRLF